MSQIQGLFKDSSRLFYSFQGLKVKKNEYEIVVPLFGAAFATPNKGTTILYSFISLSTVLSSTEKCKKDFSRQLSDFPVLLKADLIFKDFQDSSLNSSTFQACANPVGSNL